MSNRLYRSRSNRMIWGVCGGLAEYFDVDPTIVRLLTVLMLFLGGFIILAYIICAIIIPLRPYPEGTIIPPAKPGQVNAPEKDTEEARYNDRMLIGLILVLVGILFLAGVFNLFWWFRWGGFWAFALVLIGVLVVLASRRR